MRGGPVLWLVLAASVLVQSAPAVALPLRVFVGIPPLVGLTGRVGGGRVDVSCILGPGASPHTFEPTPRRLAALARADLILTVGMPFERVFLSAARPAVTTAPVADVAAGLTRRHMEGAGEAGGHEDEHCGCADEGLDPHVWLSVDNLVSMARATALALETVDPEGRADYRGNLLRLEGDLAALSRELTALMAPVRGRTMLVHHPAFGYFTDAYGLVQVPVETGGREPGPRHVASLVRRARSLRTSTVFVQRQASGRSAQALAAAIGGTVRELDPLPEDPLAGLRTLARGVLDGLGSR